MTSASDFMLAAADTGDDWKFLAASRPSVSITPLIDGVDTFRTIETAVAGAKKTVNGSAWIFNAWMPLQASGPVNKILSGRGLKSSVSRWGQLFAGVASLGVEVRLLLTDFDALLQPDLHEFNWRNYQQLRRDRTAFGAKLHMQIMVSMHDAQVGWLDIKLGGTQLTARLTDVVGGLNSGGFVSAKRQLASMPRLWSLVTVNKPKSRIDPVSSPSWDIRPAAHHQKIFIVDSAVGFCGGLDPQTGRIDTPHHDRGWHDADCQVDAPLAIDLDRNFVGRWNHEMGDFNAFIGGATFGGKKLSADAVTAMTVPSATAAAGSGTATGQLIRTLSQNAGSGTIPEVVRNDIQEAYQLAISLAQQFIYIENQYVRSTDLASWLIARAKSVPTLQVIIVLPVAPEEVKGKVDPVTNLGIALEHGILDNLRSTLGAQFGMYSMVMPQPAPKKVRATDFPWPPLTGTPSPQIYVHNKTMIIDDIWATIGSANTNPRSFVVDTEANIQWFDATSVKSLRLRLWKEMLGSPAGMDKWAPSSFVANWNAIANANQTVKDATKRRGFVLPHDPDHFNGKVTPGIPDEFAELTNTPAENDPLADDTVA